MGLGATADATGGLFGLAVALGAAASSEAAGNLSSAVANASVGGP